MDLRLFDVSAASGPLYFEHFVVIDHRSARSGDESGPRKPPVGQCQRAIRYGRTAIDSDATRCEETYDRKPDVDVGANVIVPPRGRCDSHATISPSNVNDGRTPDIG